MKKSFVHLGNLVKKIRKAHGLSQAQLAQKIGMHSQFVSNIERHLCGLPDSCMWRFLKLFGSNAIGTELRAALLKDATEEVDQYLKKFFKENGALAIDRARKSDALAGTVGNC